MTEPEPPYGYGHALTINHIVGKLIGFDEHANELSFHEVLDCWVEQAEFESERAQRRNAPQADQHILQEEVNHRIQGRGDAKRMYTELQSAADAIYQGRNHPQLVLCSRMYAKGKPEFTIESAFVWARDSWNRVIPEWAPPGASTGQGILGPTGAQSTSMRNRKATAFIITRALAKLVDKLEQDGHISAPEGQPYKNDDDEENLPAVAQYIVSIDIDGLPTREIPADDDTDILALAYLAQVFAQLADEARSNDWIKFRGKGGEIDNSPSLKNGRYITARVYDHVIQANVMDEAMSGQGKRSFHDRLNTARRLATSSGLPQFGQDQLLERLEAAQSAYAECNQ